MREPVDHPAAPLAVVFCVLAFSLGLVGPAAAAFTPAMAKRQAPGPFAAAPIVQGGWADGSPSDTVIFASGTQISGTFYQTLDASQGSLVVWITPEWNGNDGKRHDFFNNDSGTDPGAISLRAAAGSLIFRVGGSAAEEVSVNISGWVAGQPHCIVARWDNDNGLSGANRLGLSVDDVHTFATQATPPAAIGAQNYVGSDRNGLHPANAIIEGLTIYRRPLFDGTNGIDAGNGDEINLIHNSGTGLDPSYLTGSWDVVFALPTNSATGALATGTGQAWTHPRLLNLIPGNSNRGGLMLAGDAATDGWNLEGAPTSVDPLATSEKVFAGGYQVASNAANQGIYQDVSVAAGNDWVARAVVHGTCLPRLILYNQTGPGTEIGHVDGTAATRTAPNVLVLTGEAPTGSTTLRVKLVNTAASGTCYWHQAEVLANSVDNPSMERWQATTPPIASGWVNELMEAGALTQEAAIVHSGTYSFRFQGGPDTDRANYDLNVGASGDFYTIGVFSHYVSGQAPFEFWGGSAAWRMQYSATATYSLTSGNPANTWRHRAGVARRTAGTDAKAYVGQFSLAGDFIIDDFYAFPLTPVSLTVTPADAANSMESGELRVDGRDVNLLAGMPGLGTTSGTYTVGWRPRHSAANGIAFTEGTVASPRAYILSLYGAANSYIDVYWDAADDIIMEYSMGGSNGSKNWGGTGIVAGTKYTLEVAYTGGGNMTLKVNGVTRITQSGIPAAFGTAPTSVYRGSSSNGDRQGDASFSSVATAVSLAFLGARGFDSAVMVEWETASELDNLGFHLYRSVSADGPWARLNASLIPGLGSSPEGRRYRWLDGSLANGTTYFYHLEDVDASSKTTSHGPVSAVPLAGAPGSAPGSEPPTSGGKKKTASSPSCPDWVVAAYGSPAGSSASPATLTCTRHGDPEAVALGVVSRDSRSATLELKTGGFYALREASGRVRVFVPGFDFPQDPQAPALPFRRALVDAVVGRRVQLGGVRASDQVGFPGLVPTALGKVEMQVSRDGTVRASRRALPGSSPEHVSTELARLLPSVFQGETKSAVVQITPLRYDARRQQLLLAKRVLVRLLFTGRETGESGRGSFGRRERPQQPATGELLARLYTTSRGLYAVPFEQLFPGLRRGIASTELRLERQGQAQGLHLEPASAAFGPGSVLYFHADAAASSTDFSSETAWELQRAREGVQMPLVSAAPAGDAVTTASMGQASFETNRFYQPGLLDAPDLWLWEGLASGATSAKSFSLTGVNAASSQTAELEVFLQGASESGNAVDHHVSVSVNGSLAGEAQFAGKTPHRISLSVPLSLLHEGANQLSLTNVADTGVSSFVFLDRFTVSYPQISALTRGVFEGSWSEAGTVTVPGAAAALLDVTATASWLRGYEATGGSLRFRAEAGHRYLAASPQALLTPRVAVPAPSTLRSVQNQADYLLIAPGAFLAAAEPLLQRRRDQGLQARAVAFEEISDEFGHGQPSAEAIKSFLAFAFQSWTRPSARYVLLLGDSTYDPRTFVGTSQPSPLPALWTKTSYLWTVSDPLLAAVNGEDALPDLAIGRLPATTVEEANRLVQKLLAWEDSGQGLAGAAVLVADNPDLGGDFEADVDDIARSFFQGRAVSTLKLSQLGGATRPAILDALNSGLSLMSYVGHGGAAVWASENVWNSWDAAGLQAQSQQPFLLTLNCLNGYFVAPAFNSLAESLLKVEGRGAIASFSPSGLSLDGPAHQYHRALMAELTSGRHARLGDALLAAQRAYATTGAFPELLSVYHLFGDPGMQIR